MSKELHVNINTSGDIQSELNRLRRRIKRRDKLARIIHGVFDFVINLLGFQQISAPARDVRIYFGNQEITDITNYCILRKDGKTGLGVARIYIRNTDGSFVVCYDDFLSKWIYGNDMHYELSVED